MLVRGRLKQSSIKKIGGEAKRKEKTFKKWKGRGGRKRERKAGIKKMQK